MTQEIKPLLLQKYQKKLLPRARDANKGNFGHVLIIIVGPGLCINP